jgi:hypothetical protein
MDLSPTELEILIKDEQYLLEEIKYEEANLEELRQSLNDVRKKIAEEKVNSSGH